MYQLAVIGNPIAHSLSPVIWPQLAKPCGIELNYRKICAEVANFESEVEQFFASGGYCLSVTAPFKARAFALASKHTAETTLSQTANHLLLQSDGSLLAANTDGVGLVADLQRLGATLTGKNILILGSGSVIYSVLSSLLAHNPARLDLLMRNSPLLAGFQARSNLVANFQAEITYDIVINTTPNTTDNLLFHAPIQLATQALAYDLLYTRKQTLFLDHMRQRQPTIRQANGYGMLIQQAAAAFQLAFDRIPDPEPIYPILESYFNE